MPWFALQVRLEFWSSFLDNTLFMETRTVMRRQILAKPLHVPRNFVSCPYKCLFKRTYFNFVLLCLQDLMFIYAQQPISFTITDLHKLLSLQRGYKKVLNEVPSYFVVLQNFGNIYKKLLGSFINVVIKYIQNSQKQILYPSYYLRTPRAHSFSKSNRQTYFMNMILAIRNTNTCVLGDKYLPIL